MLAGKKTKRPAQGKGRSHRNYPPPQRPRRRKEDKETPKPQQKEKPAHLIKSCKRKMQKK